MKRRLTTRDGYVGIMFMALGLFFGGLTLFDLPLGTLDQMGPGYFPFALCAILTLLGIGVIAQAEPETDDMPPINLRALILIGVAPAVFGLTVRSLGLVPALLASILLAVLASPRIGLLKGAGIVLGVTVFCVVVFKYGVGVPYHLINPKFLY